MQNNKGESESPCLTPLPQEKIPTKLPLTLKESITNLRITLIQFEKI